MIIRFEAKNFDRSKHSNQCAESPDHFSLKD